MPQTLSEREKEMLLELARSTLEAHFAGSALPQPYELTDNLGQLRGAFVTLTEQGALRGCIGHVVGSRPLWQSVRENAISAALRDPRFDPVQQHELTGLHIEISALTPLHEIDDAHEVRVGHHGVMIEKGANRGLLLPQVATDNGWDRTTFLDHTCRKAGLAPGCWRSPDATVSVFSAEVFGE